MQPDVQKEKLTSVARTIKSKEPAVKDCIQIRETMDALIDGRMSLEQAEPAVKLAFLHHLEDCSACCRSFDVRVGFYGRGRSSMF